MIDISQWRANIGLWACCHISCCTHSKKTANTETRIWIDGLTMVRKIKDLTFSLGAFLLLLLILSGDVELNPGPKTGNLLKTLSMLLYIYTYVHTYIHAYIHIYIHNAFNIYIHNAFNAQCCRFATFDKLQLVPNVANLQQISYRSLTVDYSSFFVSFKYFESH